MNKKALTQRRNESKTVLNSLTDVIKKLEPNDQVLAKYYIKRLHKRSAMIKVGQLIEKTRVGYESEAINN